jgi:phosphotriesterase-related protein
MNQELTGEIERSGVKAGFVKLSAGDDGITTTETKVLRAAARAARPCGAVIGSHTIRARVVHEQLDWIEKSGYTPERFIWIHTQAESDFALHLEVARRGAWLEYDSIGSPGQDEQFVRWILALVDAGLSNQLLLSHDRGWYDPAQPGGGTPQPFTYLTQIFLPKLRAAHLSEEIIHQLTVENPFRAFSRAE